MDPSTSEAPGRIFISYRRAETDFPASWLYESLVAEFGREQVFKDVDSIELGDDFAQTIAEAVGSCEVLLALIGDRWSTIEDDDGKRRLDDPNDFVRLELEAALQRRIKVVPILVGKIPMPRAQDLPPSLGALVRRQALELSPTRFEPDVARLVRVLKRTLAETAAAREATELQAAAEKAEKAAADQAAGEREAAEKAAADRAAAEKAAADQAAADQAAADQAAADQAAADRAAADQAAADQAAADQAAADQAAADQAAADQAAADQAAAEKAATEKAAAGEAAAEKAATDEVATEQEDVGPQWSRRSRVVALAAAAVLLAVGTGYTVTRLSENTPAANTPAASGPPGSATSLPAAAPLSDTQMVVPIVVAGDWELYLADTARPGSPRRLTSSAGNDSSPVLSPDRRTMIWIHESDQGRSTLRVAAAIDGSGARDLFPTTPTQCAGAIYRPAWNPQHPEQLAVGCIDGSSRAGLYLFDVDGQLIRTYPTGSGDVGNPTFSQDGRTIAYWAWASRTRALAGGEIFTVKTDDPGTPVKLTSAASAGQDSDPVYSPSGDTIAFSRDVGKGPRLYVMAADGSGQHALIDGQAKDRNPSYSPTDGQIAFRSDRTEASGSTGHGTYRVWVATVTGAGSTMTLSSPKLLLGSSAGDQGAPAWTRR